MLMSHLSYILHVHVLMFTLLPLKLARKPYSFDGFHCCQTYCPLGKILSPHLVVQPSKCQTSCNNHNLLFFMIYFFYPTSQSVNQITPPTIKATTSSYLPNIELIHTTIILMKKACNLDTRSYNTSNPKLKATLNAKRREIHGNTPTKQ